MNQPRLVQAPRWKMHQQQETAGWLGDTLEEEDEIQESSARERQSPMKRMLKKL